MEQRFALPALAALALTALFGSLTLPAAGDVAKPGTVLTVAGTGAAGFSGDGGPATSAVLHTPRSVALDAAGNLYIADADNNRVRKVTLDGIITTVAGTGQAGYSGDKGPATNARLNGPGRLVLDAAGNLFITDRGNLRIRKVTPDGTITTVAGIGADGFSGDGGPATKARMDPTGLAVDEGGNLFIADWGNDRVRKVTPDGMITTVAGYGKQGFSGDGGPAVAARLHGPLGVAVDGAGNLYITEFGSFLRFGDIGNRVRKVRPDGIITTVAGIGGKGGFSGDGGPAIGAMLDHPGGVAVDTAGNLFILDWSNNRVRKVDPAGIITTIAGDGTARFSGEGGPATTAGIRLSFGDIAVDATGNLFFSDSGYERTDGLGPDERVLKVVGVAAPGLIAGMGFPR